MESSHDSADRRVVLRAIETTFHRWRLGARPRANYAALCGLVVAVVVLLAGETLLARVGVEFSPGNLGWLGIALVAGTVVYQLALRWSDRPLTFTEMLDRQLSEYKPLNREAYCLLQKMTRDAGALDVDLVAEWLQSERDALVSASAKRSPAPTFLERQI